MTRVLNFRQLGDWKDALDVARNTVHRPEANGYPSRKWRIEAAISEHSPIRVMEYSWKWVELPYWVSVHLVRHKFGIEHYVRTQRSDRTGVSRGELPQGALVEHVAKANGQAIINISKERLCLHASKETRYAWILVLKELRAVNRELFDVCVPKCVYRGFCPEPVACRYIDSRGFERDLEVYRNLRKI